LRLERVHSRIHNPVVLLVKKFFVYRPIDTRDSEVDTRKTRFWCFEIENPCVTSSNTANICCVHDTACPAKETIFSMCRHFSEKLFSCGHGMSSLRISLRVEETFRAGYTKVRYFFRFRPLFLGRSQRLNASGAFFYLLEEEVHMRTVQYWYQ
jgi:hypothetical protein